MPTNSIRPVNISFDQTRRGRAARTSRRSSQRRRAKTRPRFETTWHSRGAQRCRRRHIQLARSRPRPRPTQPVWTAAPPSSSTLWISWVAQRPNRRRQTRIGDLDHRCPGGLECLRPSRVQASGLRRPVTIITGPAASVEERTRAVGDARNPRSNTTRVNGLFAVDEARGQQRVVYQQRAGANRNRVHLRPLVMRMTGRGAGRELRALAGGRRHPPIQAGRRLQDHERALLPHRGDERLVQPYRFVARHAGVDDDAVFPESGEPPALGRAETDPPSPRRRARCRRR